MLYRKLGQTKKSVSILGFDTLRLPTLEGDNSKVDTEKAACIIRYAIDRGVNYTLFK